MRVRAGLVGSIAVLCGLLAGPGLLAGEVAPELPVAAWQGGSVGLEDFRGQVTALVFFNDSSG